MLGFIGRVALLLALPVAAYGIFASVFGVRRHHPGLVASGRNAVFATFGLATMALVAMEVALLTHDFSVSYVAEVGSRDTPTLITAISLWAALDGSILFWLWVLTLYSMIVALLYRRRRVDEMPYVLATLLGITVFFLIVLVGPGNPFEQVWPVPLDGRGPNPILQNHPMMALHPPAQYLGYVGFSVPFAFAVAALVTGRVGAWWVRAVRRWTLVSWIFLTLALASGGWWAYEVLGWGGYWAWDPVENAALMPWLTATAFLHSIMIQERRDMLRGWNVSLIVVTFALTILGTFLTRSGVLGSVHAFTQSLIGPLFLGFVAVVLVFSTALLLWRSDRLRTDGSLDSVLSREAAFLIANLVFVSLTFTILLGTLFPLVAEAVAGTKVSVGEPYFNRMTVPLLASLIFLMGVGPALPWGRTSLRRAGSDFSTPFIGGIVGVALAALLGVHGFWPLLTLGLSAFAAVVMAREILRGVRTRVLKGENPAGALLRIVTGNPRRYGGYIVHFGVLMVAVAITASWNYSIDVEATLRPGDAMSVGDYFVRFENLQAREEQHRFSVIAVVAIDKNGTPLGRLEPRLNFYPSQSEPVLTPAVRSSLKEDLYVTLTAFPEDGSSATIRVIVTPLVMWLWVGVYVMVAGTVVALAPVRRKSRPRGDSATGGLTHATRAQEQPDEELIAP